jgi:hypothetical protein
VLKILKFLDADLDPGSIFDLEPGSGMENFDPSSGIKIPDLQHCVCNPVHKHEIIRPLFYGWDYSFHILIPLLPPTLTAPTYLLGRN